ncbi:phosphotransferase [Nonomuraea sp. NPDC049758]|uniref:phosphotransferase n=1 Tax=Nonomuraea sp. NPDC049758 TaxID=3154360 RepID=UPI00341F4B0D
MTSSSALHRGLAWAAGELRSRNVKYSHARVLPWSATARFTVGSDSFWIKISPLSQSAAEAAILTRAATLGLRSMPRLIAASEELGACVLAHVEQTAQLREHHQAEEAASAISADLAMAGAGALAVPALSVDTCLAGILRACRATPWWLTPPVARALAETISTRQDDVTELDRRLDGTHTVVHGDLHPGNVLPTRDGLVIIDWADAALGHQLWDRATYRSATGYEDRADALSPLYPVLCALKELFDYSRMPDPCPGAGYSTNLPTLVAYASRRALSLLRSLAAQPTWKEALS